MLYKFNLYTYILFLNNKLTEVIKFYESNFIKNNLNLNLIYMKFSLLTLFRIFYLLITLIIIVKIIFFIKLKPIRQLSF